jgi:hypothetical protein
LLSNGSTCAVYGWELDGGDGEFGMTYTMQLDPKVGPLYNFNPFDPIA